MKRKTKVKTKSKEDVLIENLQTIRYFLVNYFREGNTQEQKDFCIEGAIADIDWYFENKRRGNV